MKVNTLTYWALLVTVLATVSLLSISSGFANSYSSGAGSSNIIKCNQNQLRNLSVKNGFSSSNEHSHFLINQYWNNSLSSLDFYALPVLYENHNGTFKRLQVQLVI